MGATINSGIYIANNKGNIKAADLGTAAGIGAATGAAAVLFSGTSALVSATTLTEILTADLSLGLVGTFAGAVTDLSLTLLTNAPVYDAPITLKRPQCKLKDTDG